MGSGFLFTNMSTVSVTASSEIQDYPATNLLTYTPVLRWVASSSVSPQWVQFNFDTDISANTCVIENHNCDSVMATVELQYADDEEFTSNVTTAATIIASDASLQYDTFNAVTKRYWRINYSGSFATEPYLGSVMIGMPVTTSRDYSWGYKKDNRSFDTIEKVNIRGRIQTAQSYRGRYKYELSFKTLTDASRNAFAGFVNDVKGKLYPFYFIDHENIVRYVHFGQDYNPVQIARINVNDITNLAMNGAYIVTVGDVSTAVISGIVEDEWIDSVA